MNEATFKELLKRVECDTLDFKAIVYDWNSEAKKLEFVVDLLCMSNTPRQESAFIILGIDKSRTLTGQELVGIEPPWVDPSLLNDAFQKFKVDPAPVFSFQTLDYEGLTFGIIELPPERRLCLPREDKSINIGAKKVVQLRKGNLYYRKNSDNAMVETPADFQRIHQWIDHGEITDNSSFDLPREQWSAFWAATTGFDTRQRYVLLVPRIHGLTQVELGALGKLPWSVVFDLDPDSDQTGLLSAAKSNINQERALYLATKGDKPPSTLDSSTYWYFLRGIRGRETTLVSGDLNLWVKQYGNELYTQLLSIARILKPTPIKIITVWTDSELFPYMAQVLSDSLRVFEDHADFITVCTNQLQESQFPALIQGEKFRIPLTHLCAGIESVSSRITDSDSNHCDLISSSGAPIRIQGESLRHIGEEIELVSLNTGLQPPTDDGPESTPHYFLRGGAVSWYDLNIHRDVDRDITAPLEQVLRSYLLSRRTIRVNLFHEPGAGGTTVARRILWNLHTQFPTGVLHRAQPIHTANRIATIHTQTGLPVFLLIEGENVVDSQIEDLFNELKKRNVHAVLLNVQRRSTLPSSPKNSYHLKCQLTDSEAVRFLESYSRVRPERREKLIALSRENGGRFRSAFFFGLEAFQADFNGLTPYVQTRINDLTPVQIEILLLFAFAHHYAQRPLPIQALAPIVQMPRNKLVALSELTGRLDVDLSKIEDRVQVGDKLITKYSTLSKLKEARSFCNENYHNRIPFDEYKNLELWILAKEERGEDAFGYPPIKIPDGTTTDNGGGSLLPRETMELLIEGHSGYCRTIHELVAQEIIEQILSGNSSDRRSWKHSLSDWAIKFACFCRGEESIPSDEMTEIANRVFILRDNTELLGTESASLKDFAQIIEDIPAKEGRLAVLSSLTEIYPDEPHFSAHLGRFYSLEMRDYDAALRYIDRALQIEDRDPIFHHIRGMTIRQKIYDLMSSNTPLADLIQLAKQAGGSFSRARELSPEREHGYISEMQMLLRLIDFAGRKNQLSPLAYLSSPAAESFLRDSIETIEDLLLQVRMLREGESPSEYEEKCRGQLDLLYGDYSQALQTWNSLLQRKGVSKPTIRRQIVWSYLARCSRNWESLPPSDLQKIVDLLEENLNEDKNPKDNSKNLRLWLRAIRYQKNPPSMERIIEKVVYWKTTSFALESVYYLYVLHSLQAMQGLTISRHDAEQALKECINSSKHRRNKHHEWLGKGTGIQRLVPAAALGEWNDDTRFYSFTDNLDRIEGIISNYFSPVAGEIELAGGLKAFFVPVMSGHDIHSKNRPISCYISFNYEGLRAWEVKDSRSVESETAT